MTSTLDPQQRVGRFTVGVVVAIVAAAFGVQAVKTLDSTEASASPTLTTSPGPSLPDVALASLGPEAKGRADVDETEKPIYTFVSAPDLLNADIGDIRTLPTWQQGMPNSDNKTDEDSLRRLYSDINSWNPDAVFVAGDEVRGHWDQDGSGLKIFGPVGTDEEKAAAIKKAGDFYYGVWKNRFPANGIPFEKVYPALGDHEIGDNPWPAGTFELAAVPLFKQVWANQFTTVGGGPNRFPYRPTGTQWEDTAYATYLTPRLLLVSVDTFSYSKESLDVTVEDGQLTWLEEVLSGAPEGTKIIVQGHVPTLTPVRTRGSSALHLEYGGASQFWQLLKKYGVNLYLNGEVHDFTATQLEDREPIQIAHGGLFAHGTTTYIVGRVYADGQITIDARLMPDQATPAMQAPRLWQTRNNLQWKVRLPDYSNSVGTMVIDGDNRIVSRTGVMKPYEPGVGYVLEDTENAPDLD